MSQNETTVNTTPMKAKNTAAKQKFLQLGTIKDIYDRMLKDKDCGVILTLAGSLISAGLKKVIVDMVRNNMVDAIVSTGANIVDQDFFEALGFRHYIASDKLKSGLFDGELREHALDRI